MRFWLCFTSGNSAFQILFAEPIYLMLWHFLLSFLRHTLVTVSPYSLVFFSLLLWLNCQTPDDVFSDFRLWTCGIFMTINAKSLYQPTRVWKLCAQSLPHLFLLLVWTNFSIGRKVVHQWSIFSQLVNVGLYGYGTQKGILLLHDYLLETSWKYLFSWFLDPYSCGCSVLFRMSFFVDYCACFHSATVRFAFSSRRLPMSLSNLMTKTWKEASLLQLCCP